MCYKELVNDKYFIWDVANTHYSVANIEEWKSPNLDNENLQKEVSNKIEEYSFEDKVSWVRQRLKEKKVEEFRERRV